MTQHERDPQPVQSDLLAYVASLNRETVDVLAQLMVRVEHVQQAVHGMSERVNDLSKQFGVVAERVEHLAARVDKVEDIDDRLKKIEQWRENADRSAAERIIERRRTEVLFAVVVFALAIAVIVLGFVVFR